MKSSKLLILSTAYLPTISYLTMLANADNVFIETHENYIKQSYRNRCEIYGANGKLPLSVPIKKINSTKSNIRDILIDYSTSWQRLHWISIESAYRSSPFFEFYMDDFIGYYNKKFKFLFDFNMELITVILKALELDNNIKLTKEFIPDYNNETTDLRSIIHPKKKADKQYPSESYIQVFIDKHGFIPNLSIIDLIFNEGPNAISFLA